MSTIGVALVTKCITSCSQRRLRQGYISHLYSSKRRFSRPSLLTRRSASVFKVGVSYESKIAKCVASYSQRRLNYGCIIHLYSSKRRFSRPSLLTRRSASVLKVGVLYKSKIAKCVASYCQRRLNYGCIIHLYSSKRHFSHPSLLAR